MINLQPAFSFGIAALLGTNIKPKEAIVFLLASQFCNQTVNAVADSVFSDNLSLIKPVLVIGSTIYGGLYAAKKCGYNIEGSELAKLFASTALFNALFFPVK